MPLLTVVPLGAAAFGIHTGPLLLMLALALALGVIHGLTPDEHTWPITLSYAIGSSSGRRGMRSALAFSLAFTLQRAIVSELAYLGLVRIREDAGWNAAVYAVVGIAMALAGFYVLRLRGTLHLHLWPPRLALCRRGGADSRWATRTPSPGMAAVHGFIAGFGFGAFALTMATVLAPAMPSAALGWAPGALFGAGTTLVLVGAGALIGALTRRGRLDPRAAQRGAQEAAGWTLLVGGALFLIAGLVGLVDPAVMSAGVATGLNVPNLDQLGVATALVASVVLVAAVALWRALRRLRSEPAGLREPQAPAGVAHHEAAADAATPA
jgi:hypothetical protein